METCRPVYMWLSGTAYGNVQTGIYVAIRDSIWKVARCTVVLNLTRRNTKQRRLYFPFLLQNKASLLDYMRRSVRDGLQIAYLSLGTSYDVCR
jgi:hypothetical protein